MARTSKDLARRLRYQRTPGRGRVLRWYLPLAVLAIVAGLGLWWVLDVTLGEEQFLPGQVAAGHAAFGDACETCHAPFQPVRDDACLTCHPPGGHSPHQVDVPACASCHIEHRGPGTLVAIADASCLACHGDLQTTRSVPSVQQEITSFGDHPTFRPLRAGSLDAAALRFNHQVHLTSTRIPEVDRLACESCHRPEADGALMAAIAFGQHCDGCHPQQVQGPLGAIDVPHDEPPRVRDALAATLLAIAVDDPAALFGARPERIPGRRSRGPLATAHTLQQYRATWLQRIEADLYRAFEPPPPATAVLQTNERCFLCHEQAAASADSGPPILPMIAPTQIAHRWLAGAAFSHRPHRLVTCETCHATSATSVETSDVNLPGRDVCADCHTADSPRSAGVDCVLCHRYHDAATS